MRKEADNHAGTHVMTQPGDRSRRANSKEKTSRVLIVEDDAEMRSMLAEALRAEGYLVDVFPDGIHLMNTYLCEAGESPRLAKWDVIISDIRMPGLSGMTVLGGLRTSGCHLPPTIVITAFGDEETHAEARRIGVAAVFDKPFEVEDLIDRVQELSPPVK